MTARHAAADAATQTWPELNWRTVTVAEQMAVIGRILAACTRLQSECTCTDTSAKLGFRRKDGSWADESLTIMEGRRQSFRTYYFTGNGRGLLLGTMHSRASASPIVCFDLVATTTLCKITDGHRRNITIAEFLGISLDYDKHLEEIRKGP